MPKETLEDKLVRIVAALSVQPPVILNAADWSSQTWKNLGDKTSAKLVDIQKLAEKATFGREQRTLQIYMHQHENVSMLCFLCLTRCEVDSFGSCLPSTILCLSSSKNFTISSFVETTGNTASFLRL